MAVAPEYLEQDQERLQTHVAREAKLSAQHTAACKRLAEARREAQHHLIVVMLAWAADQENRRWPVLIAPGDPRARGLESCPIWGCRSCQRTWHWPTPPVACGFCTFADVEGEIKELIRPKHLRPVRIREEVA